MQTQTLTTQSWDVDNSVWQKTLWLSAVTLSLGLCLLVWKRPLAEELVDVVPEAVVATQTQASSAVPVKMVVRVNQISYRPVWASALAEADLIYDEYPQAVASRVA